jgi:Ca-activated chloride channel homolog
MTLLGIDILRPWVLLIALVAVPVLALFYARAFRTKDRLMAQFARQELFKRLLPDVSRPRQVLKAVFVLAAVVAVVVALTRPRYGYEWEEIQRKGVDIVVVLDLSTSMLAEDIEPNRLERARRELADLLDMLEGDRLGLVAFAGTAFVQCPLTVDYRAYRLFLESLHPAMMPVQGTDLGVAIERAVQTFDEEKLSSKAIILISDGEDNEGKGYAAAEQAAELGIKIFAIGVGGEAPAPVPDLEKGGSKRDRMGEVVLTSFDEDGLKKIALVTGGGYERSTSGDMDLEAIYRQDIKQGMEAYQIATSRTQNWKERYQWPLGLAFLLLVLESLLPEVRRRSRRGSAAILLLIAMVTVGVAGPAAAAWRNPFAPSPMRQGMKAFGDGEFDEALKHFHTAQLDLPDDRRLEFNIADSYYRLEDYASAEQSFGRVLSLGGDDSLAQRAYYNLGNTLYFQGRLEEAIDAYEQALVLDPEDEDARHNLEFVRQELEQRQQQCEQRREQEKQQQQQQPQQNREQHEETQQDERQESAEQAEQQQASEQDMINVDPTREADPDEPQVEGPPPVQLTPEEADRLLDALDERRPDMRQQQRRKQKEKDW